MSALKDLQKIQAKNKSYICLGLDIDPKKMPGEYGDTMKGMFEFTHRIIDATADLVCAYKPNLAFYESLGHEGLSLLKLIVQRIPEGIPVILDAKRGDIGNTAAQYAISLYEKLGAHWVTLSPYMGYDSIRPFLEYKDRGAFVLCLTSEPGCKDFQYLKVDGGKPLYEVVAEKVAYWNKESNCGLVVAATSPDQITRIRQIAGEMPLLIPGVGAQGGSLEHAAKDGSDNFTKPVIINVSRSVLYASQDMDFAQRARAEIAKLTGQINMMRPEAQNQHAQQPQSSQPSQQSQEQSAPEVSAPVETTHSDSSEVNSDSQG